MGNFGHPTVVIFRCSCNTRHATSSLFILLRCNLNFSLLILCCLAMRRFFVPTNQIHHSLAVISGDEFHHLRRVLRVRLGDEITICDDHGREHYGTVVTLSPTSAEVTIRHTQLVQTPRVPLTLGLGMLKGQKMDLVIEKVTELGVDRIVPFISTFTVSQLPTERQSERLARWQRIAQSAAKQSGSSVPQILTPQTFAQICDSRPPDATTLLFYEQE